MDGVEYETGPMDPRDYDRLRRAVGWSSYAPGEIQEGLDGTLFAVVARVRGEAAAMGRVIGDGKMAFYIQDVIVLPEFQGRGIGTEIMRTIMGWIDSRSVDHSIVGLMAAAGKEAFYEGFGFVRRPNEKMGCGMNIWVAKGAR